jgi:hypothetical protein
MIQEEESACAGGSARILRTAPVVTVIICACISVFFIRTGFFSLFYLAPLGYAVMASGSLWLTFSAAAVINTVVSVVSRLIAGNAVPLWLEVFYFSTMFLGFIWIMGGTSFRTAYRFILAAAAGTIAFLVFINNRSSDFYSVLKDTAAAILYSSEGEAAGRSFLQQMLAPEKIQESFKNILLRGGALASVLFIFFINRQISLAAFWFLKKQRKNRGLTAFYAPPYTIWALLCALAFLLLTRQLKLQIFEIAAWNVSAVCVILFLAQGAGVLMHMLLRLAPAFRLVINILIIVLIFSPLSAAAFAALLLLGIAENWLPLREPKQGPASTPEP